MPRFLLPAVASMFLAMAVHAGVVRGVLLNDDDPYIIKATDGTIYNVEWYGGSSLSSEGARVILTKDYARAQMVSPGDDYKMTEVSVEELDE